MSIKKSSLTLKHHPQDTTSISAYQFVDEQRKKSAGGLVLIMEIFGVNHHIRGVCQDYARLGYRVLAPQIYDRLEKNFARRYTQEGVQKALKMRDRHDIHQGVRDIQNAIDWLKAQGEEKVFTVGYCYGGSLVWLSCACCEGLSAGASYYGGRIREFVKQTPQCPIVLHFGAQDSAIPLADIEAIRQAHPALPVHAYQGADHGFNCDDQERNVHNSKAAKKALERTLTLFEESSIV